MRKTLFFLGLLITNIAIAQVKDDFSDGNFTANPTWLGSTNNFEVIDGVLAANGPQSGSQTIYLSTANTLFGNTAFEFLVTLGFDPSTTNYPRIYLGASQQDLTATSNRGYYLQLGSTGSSDNFTLYRQDATSTALLTLKDKVRPVASSVNVRVRVERTSGGRWDIYTDFTGGRNFTWDGGITDNTYTTAAYFGLYCRYQTVSRYNQFKFDDISVATYADVEPPKLVASRIIQGQKVELDFNEALDVASAEDINNYLVGSKGKPTSAKLEANATTVSLTYNSTFDEGTYNFNVANLKDVKGNVITSSINANVIYAPYVAKSGDVVINEIMAAPATSAVLNKEFIELYNTTDRYIVITGWKYKDASASTATFAADTLAPKSYRILCASADVALYKTYGKVLGLSPWPSLNNDKDDLYLYLPDGTSLINQVSYADTWYRDNNKKSGYSLELINPTGTCGGAFNWTASAGTNNATPGAQNSALNLQHTDNVAPKLVAVTILSSTRIQVDFDKAINLAALLDVNNYTINNGIGVPTSVTLNEKESSVILDLSKEIGIGIENYLTVTNMANCGGIPLDAKTATALFIITDVIKPGDILVSEILFNPYTGGEDFVEIYNNTDKILNLKDLQISNPSVTTEIGSAKRTITTNSVYIKPKSYWVLTGANKDVLTKYNVPNPLQVVSVSGGIPTFATASGTVKLWSGVEIIDELSYTEKMHHVLLKELKGVSLERVSFDKSGNVAGNLQSAATSVGYATPTYQNSQSEDPSVKNGIALQFKTFSPDNDGFEDELKIDYQFKENGNIGSIEIYSDRGILVRKLARNISFSTKGTIMWDGLNDAGNVCKVGVYIVKASFFNLMGQTSNFTKTCVLATKLN